MKKMKEGDLQRLIIDYLEAKKYLVIKQQSGALFNPQKGYIPMRRTGIPDLLFCSPTGQFGAIEVKIKPNKATEDQLYFLSEVEQRGGVAILAYSLEEIIEKIKNN